MSCFIKVTRTTMPWPMGWSYFQVQTKDPQLEASSPLQHHGSWSDGLLQLTPEADEDSSLLVGGWDLPEEGHCCPHVGHAVQDRGKARDEGVRLGRLRHRGRPGHGRPGVLQCTPSYQGPGQLICENQLPGPLGLGLTDGGRPDVPAQGGAASVSQLSSAGS